MLEVLLIRFGCGIKVFVYILFVRKSYRVIFGRKMIAKVVIDRLFIFIVNFIYGKWGLYVIW